MDQMFIAPEGFHGTGLYIGGGWHQLVTLSVAGTTIQGLVMPAEGNWASLGGLGFQAAPTAEIVPVAVATDGFPDVVDAVVSTKASRKA